MFILDVILIKGKDYFIPSDAKKKNEFRESYLYYSEIKFDVNEIACEYILTVIDVFFLDSFLKS